MRLLHGVLVAGALAALLAGLPWALIRFIGWPLPHQLPSWADVEAMLLAPMTVTFLLDILACAAWLAWALFTLDVVRCTIELLRNVHVADLSTIGPMRRVATVLVGALLVSLLGQRAGATTTTSPADRLDPTVVATAPAWPAPRHLDETATQGIAVVAHASTDDAAAVGTPPGQRSVIVRTPENGVHDSLWRIAARTLGDGARWPEIFELNKGRPQPHGRTFTDPSLIFPGLELALPDDATVPPPPPSQDTPPPAAAPDPSRTPPAPRPSDSETPSPSTHNTSEAPPTTADTKTPPPGAQDPGVRWGPELFVGLGLAATVSAALVVARRRHNSRYRPGSGDREELPLAPVVYQLRQAHLRTEAIDTRGDTEFDLDDLADNDQPNLSISSPSYGKGERSRHAPRTSAFVVGAPEKGSVQRPALAPGLGVRNGREIALNLATAHGLGIIGPGAAAATRALLIAALTTSTAQPTTPPPVTTSVLVPADDLARLLGRTATHTALPTTVRIVRDLDDALNALEAEILVRATAREFSTAHPWPALMLVAQPPEHARQRLQAVLDNGAPFGITGLLLGQWRPGVTAYVRADGTISATGPGLGERLRGTRVFRLGGNDTAELLALLHQAEPIAARARVDETVSLPPTPRRLMMASELTRGEDYDGRLEPHADVDVDRGLEVTAAIRGPVPTDTEWKIGPRHSTVPRARLRPSAVPHQESATPRVHQDTEFPIAVPGGGNHKVSVEDSGEVGDEPIPVDDHGTAAAAFLTDAVPLSEDTQAAEAASASITIAVLGPLRVRWNPERRYNDTATLADTHRRGREITGVLPPRARELLVLLALHPDGITREALVSALWDQDPPARPTNALHTALSRLRHAVTAATEQAVTDIVVVGNGRYQLDPTKVTVDYWRFANAVAARRAAATPHERVDSYREVVNSYSGPLAEGMTTEWIEPAREAIRRDAIDAVAALARSLVETDPQQTLDLLEVARAFDPHNELLYRDIMRLQDRLGQHDAIPRTLTLLATRLAELDETPSPQARGLAAQLSDRHSAAPDVIADTDSASAARRASKGGRGRNAAS